jgi:hypothetical protein
VVKSHLSGRAALVLAFLALVLSFTGWADAAREAVLAKLRPGDTLRLDARGKVPAKALPFKVTRKPKAGAVLRLGRKGRFPAKALPAPVPRARRADRLGRQPARAYLDRCPDDTVDLGTWCLTNTTHTLDRGDIGKNDYFFAEQACGARGGYLPTAGQLIAAADEVRLRSTIDDRRLTANIDEDQSDGLKDQREMTSTLVTVSSGSSASGSIGVTAGSKGDPRQGEPDPFPQPRDPSPSTLQYVTVFDNANKGGFAGSKPVGEPEAFRCAFNKAQQRPTTDID